MVVGFQFLGLAGDLCANPLAAASAMEGSSVLGYDLLALGESQSLEKIHPSLGEAFRSEIKNYQIFLSKGLTDRTTNSKKALAHLTRQIPAVHWRRVLDEIKARDPHATQEGFLNTPALEGEALRKILRPSRPRSAGLFSKLENYYERLGRREEWNEKEIRLRLPPIAKDYEAWVAIEGDLRPFLGDEVEKTEAEKVVEELRRYINGVRKHYQERELERLFAQFLHSGGVYLGEADWKLEDVIGEMVQGHALIQIGSGGLFLRVNCMGRLIYRS